MTNDVFKNVSFVLIKTFNERSKMELSKKLLLKAGFELWISGFGGDCCTTSDVAIAPC